MPATVAHMHDFWVRPAVRDDAEGIAALGGVMGYEVTAADATARLSALPAGDAVFVAHDTTGEVVGFVHVYLDHSLLVARRAQLAGLSVAAGWHRRGVGGQLLARAESWAGEHGCGLLQVRSGVERMAAHGFYEHAGYQRLKQQQVFTKVLG